MWRFLTEDESLKGSENYFKFELGALMGHIFEIGSDPVVEGSFPPGADEY